MTMFERVLARETGGVGAPRGRIPLSPAIRAAPAGLQQTCQLAATARHRQPNTGFFISTFCTNYGGRRELGSRRPGRLAESGWRGCELVPGAIDEAAFAGQLQNGRGGGSGIC